ncbi:MAG: hypothetical protein JSW07_16950, partial [bacterium]
MNNTEPVLLNGLHPITRWLYLLVVFTFLAVDSVLATEEYIGLRQILSFDGIWEIAEGDIDDIPDHFAHRVPVPGLVDMATPSFAEVGKKSELREAFWYRHTFRVNGTIPDVALLKIHKAKYSMRVFLNGQHIGDHLSCFTPAFFNIREHLKGSGTTNELLICIGASRDAIPDTVPSGWDKEKTRYIPGIYDSVELILTETPHIMSVQTVPDITNKMVRVVVRVYNWGETTETSVKCYVREKTTTEVVGSAESQKFQYKSGDERSVVLQIPIKNCNLWSPEAPFLYELETSTTADNLKTQFGMRTFHFDPVTKMPMLNGKPYYLRGSSVCIFRFFEDPQRADLPWR